MSPNYRKRRQAKLLERSRKGVEARERKRMERDNALVEIGQIVTNGCLGSHCITLMAWPDESRAIAVFVNGKHRIPRTLLGVLRCLAQMIAGRFENMQRAGE